MLCVVGSYLDSYARGCSAQCCPCPLKLHCVAPVDHTYVAQRLPLQAARAVYKCLLPCCNSQFVHGAMALCPSAPRPHALIRDGNPHLAGATRGGPRSTLEHQDAGQDAAHRGSCDCCPQQGCVDAKDSTAHRQISCVHACSGPACASNATQRSRPLELPRHPALLWWSGRRALPPPPAALRMHWR